MKKESLIVWGIGLLVLVGVVFGVMRMSNSNSLALTLPEPVTAKDHMRGSADAKAVLVEYGDYQCPACGAYHPLIKKLLTEENGKVNVVFRNFPLPQHQNAIPAAYAAEAAGMQGKFWDMFDMIYEHQSDWEDKSNAVDIFVEYAKTLRLDVLQYQKDFVSSAVRERAQHEKETGITAGINSTPTFFLNGKSITVTSYDQLKQLIEQAQ